MVGHGPPRVILRWWLRKPDVARVASKLPAFKCTDDRIAVAYLATRCIYQIRAPLHLPDERVVEEVFGLRVQWSVDCNHVTNTDHKLDVRVVSEVQLLLDILRKPMPISVVKFDVERLQPSQNSQADAAGRNRTNLHRFEIMSVPRNPRYSSPR